MKKLFWATLAVAIGFASCSKDSDAGQKKGDAYASVSFTFTNDFTRGGFDQISPDESSNGLDQSALAITGELHVFIAKGGNLLVKEALNLNLATDYDNNETRPFTHKTGSDGNPMTGDQNRLKNDIDQVILVGNAPADFATKYASATTVADLSKIVYDLSAAEASYSAATPNNKIWVQGETKTIAEVDTGTDGNVTVTNMEAEISLRPVLSRLDVNVSLSCVTDGIFASTDDMLTKRKTEAVPEDKTKGGIVIQSVSVLYSAKGYSLVEPFVAQPTTSTESDPVLTSGLNFANYTAWAASAHGYTDTYGDQATENFLFAAWNGTAWLSNPNIGSVSGTANYVENNDGNAFQTGTFKRTLYALSPKSYSEAGGFLGTGTAYKPYTIVTIHAKEYKVVDNAGTLEIGAPTAGIDRFFSLKFDGEDGSGGEELVPGNRYLVNLTMTGDFSNGGGGGSTPEDDGYASLIVKVNPAQWKTVITVNKDFGPNP